MVSKNPHCEKGEWSGLFKGPRNSTRGRRTECTSKSDGKNNDFKKKGDFHGKPKKPKKRTSKKKKKEPQKKNEGLRFRKPRVPPKLLGTKTPFLKIKSIKREARGPLGGSENSFCAKKEKNIKLASIRQGGHNYL